MQHIVALEGNENGLDRVVLNLLIYVTFCGSLRTAELINALLQSFSLNGSNLHNGQTLRMPELNGSPFSPHSRLDRFMVLKQARGMDFYLFHYSFPGLLHLATAVLSVGHDHMRNASIALCQNPICLWNEKSVFLCRCGPFECDTAALMPLQTHISSLATSYTSIQQ